MSNAATVEQTISPLLGGQLIGATGGGTATAVELNSLPCRLVDPELFFAESPADVEYAKSLCRDCPLQQACLAGALERHEPWGVWGGELFVQGAVVARKRPRGRPRKHPLPEPVTPVAPANRQPARALTRAETRSAPGRTTPGRTREEAA